MDYEAKLEDFYSRLDLKGRMIIDVGAHLGRHVLPLAELAGPTGSVHAFEPIPGIRQQLALNVHSHGLNNVVIYPFALANVTTVSEFNFVPNLPEESGLKARHKYNLVPEAAQKILVPTYKLDDVVSPHSRPAFVKIDIEGGELDMLSGFTVGLESSRPIVAFECGASSFLGYHDSPEKIFSIFNTRGYRVYSITGILMGDENHFRQSSFEQKFWDYIALPTEQIYLATLLAT